MTRGRVRPPINANRMTLLADAAYFTVELERRLLALIEIETGEQRRRAWFAGVAVTRKLRALLINERQRHRNRAKSNRQRARRRREAAQMTDESDLQ
jgi:hypothetical protein